MNSFELLITRQGPEEAGTDGENNGPEIPSSRRETCLHGQWPQSWLRAPYSAAHEHAGPNHAVMSGSQGCGSEAPGSQHLVVRCFPWLYGRAENFLCPSGTIPWKDGTSSSVRSDACTASWFSHLPHRGQPLPLQRGCGQQQAFCYHRPPCSGRSREGPIPRNSHVSPTPGSR